MVDFHNHLMPGVDDGAQTIEQSCVALSALAQDSVHTIITTPHLDGSLTRDPGQMRARMNALDAAWVRLAEHAAEHHAVLVVRRGVELMLDTPEPNVEDARLRLAGGRFILVEFPFMTVPPRSADVIASLCARGVWPIIAHPERYAGFAEDYSLAEQWRRSGGCLQVNGASLLGKYGPLARRFALGLLERGWADYMCSDYHARGSTSISAYRTLLAELGGLEQVQLLTEANPARVLASQAPFPVPQLRLRRSLWGRVSEIFRAQ